MSGARLIVASRYLKSGKKKSSAKRKNYTKYIATRETVEIRPQKKYDLHGDATAAQKNLLKELLDDFPDAKQYHEYTDYEMHPSAENCSELINAVIERNADVIGNKKNLVGYMAMRPGAEKRGAHGLFTDSDAPIVLNQVADEIAHHEGNVWSHVISLRREDAVRLGYDNSESWRQLVKRHIADIAAAQKISLCNLKWYGAFHNTTHHPHIHLLVYSTNPKEGFLTTDGIEKIKSVLANDIFKDELQSIYQEQTVSRDALRKISAEEFETIIRQIHSGCFDEPELEMLVKKLYVQLQSAKGKKVYGYLPKEIKQTVDLIFKMLAKNEQIAALYEKWCDLERLKYKTYTMQEPELPLIYLNKVFQPVRNQIIRTVLKMGEISESEIIPQDENEFVLPDTFVVRDEPEIQFESNSGMNPFCLSWSKKYKRARELLSQKNASASEIQECLRLLNEEVDCGNVLALYDLGKLYASGGLDKPNEELSAQYYSRALEGFLSLEPDADIFQPYLQYRIGKMYALGLGTEQDDAAAAFWFEKAANAGNKYAQYSLANCYYYGKGVEQNDTDAIKWYAKSAEKNMPYASYALAKMHEKGEGTPPNEGKAQQWYKDALSGFLQIASHGNADSQLLYKLGRMFQRGLGTDADAARAVSFYLQAAEQHGQWAEYQLGRIYLFGADGITPDREKAAEWFVKSAEDGNPYAQEWLEHMDEYEQRMLADTVTGLFFRLAAIIEERYTQEHKQMQVDSKLRRMIRRKKMELGIKEEGYFHQQS